MSKNTIRRLTGIACMIVFIIMFARSISLAEDHEAGWNQIEGKWYYYYASGEGNYYSCGAFGIDGKCYLLEKDGSLVQNQAGWYELSYVGDYYGNGVLYSVVEGYTIDAEGVVQEGWHFRRISDDEGYSYEDWYYIQSDGSVRRGWKEIDGKWYYFYSNQACRDGGELLIDGKMYLFGNDGALIQHQPGWYETTKPYGAEGAGEYFVRYYFLQDNEVAYKWQTIDGKRYYFNPEQACPQGGHSYLIDGKVYIFGPEGALAQNQAGWYELTTQFDDGTVLIEGYTINDEGAVKAGWHMRRYIYSNESTWENWYYISNDCVEESGWKDIDGKRYYFSPLQVCRDGGFTQIDGKTYVFGADGALILNQPGWHEWSRTNDEGTEYIDGYTTDAEGAFAAGWRMQKILYSDGSSWERWYYLKNDESYEIGWKKIDGKWYYFKEDYSQVCHGGGTYTINGKTYVFGTDGALVQNQAGWYECHISNSTIEGYTIDVEGAVTAGWHVRKYVGSGTGSEYWYYLKEDGSYEVGWKKIDGKWYYFYEYGQQACRDGGAARIDDKYYLFGEGGAQIQNQPGWYKTSISYGNETLPGAYYFITSEELASGWEKIDGKWYFFIPEQVRYNNAGVYITLFDEDGVHPYVFGEDGALVQNHPGLYEFVSSADENCVVVSGYTIDSEGAVKVGLSMERYQYSNGEVEEKWYYTTLQSFSTVFDHDVVGWYKIDGKWYYFSPELVGRNGGTFTIDGKLYLFGSDGALIQRQRGWYENQNDSGIDRYYFKNAEELATGWFKIDGEWFFFDTDGKLCYRFGWQKIDGKWYYFNETPNTYRYGKMVCPAGGTYLMDNGTPYFFDTNGALVTGESGWKKWTRIEYQQIKTLWSYIDIDGIVATGLQTIGGKKYYFDDQGIMLENDVALVDGKYYVFGAGGAQVTKSGWCKVLTDSYAQEYSWYYIDENGTAKVGWLKDGGKWYYLFPKMACNETATIVEGGIGKEYLFDKSGALVQYKAGWNKKTYTVNGETLTDWYYLNTAGEIQYGYKKIDGEWYYLRENDGRMVSGQAWEVEGEYKLFTNDGSQAVTPGWYKCRYRIDEEWEHEWCTYWYYIDANGKLADGWKKIDGKWYYFSYGACYCPNGGVASIKGKYYFFANGGALGSKGWNKLTRTENGESIVYWYYLNSDGVVQTGWQKIDGKWYYFTEESYDAWGSMLSDGLYLVDGAYEYFNPNGICETAMGNSNWRRVGGKLRYVLADGTYVTGWKRIGTKDFFFDTNGDMVRGWVEYSGNKYYFDPNPCTGVCSIDEDEYIFYENGVLAKDCLLKAVMRMFFTEFEDWYYADSLGRVYYGWKQLDGKWYYFSPHMVKDNLACDNGRYYRMDKDGVWTGESWKVADY